MVEKECCGKLSILCSVTRRRAEAVDRRSRYGREGREWRRIVTSTCPVVHDKDVERGGLVILIRGETEEEGDEEETRGGRIIPLLEASPRDWRGDGR